MAESVWPKLRRDLGNTSFTPANVSGNAGREVWRFDLAGRMSFGPLIGPDGTIHVSAWRDRPERTLLYALNPDGSLKWTWQIETICCADPVIDNNGCLYFPGYNKRLYAIGSSGELLWESPTRNLHTTACTVCAGGICFGVGNDVVCYSLDGELRWTCRLRSDASSAALCPAIGTDGTVYCVTDIAANRATLFAISSEGDLKWKVPFGTCPITESEVMITSSPMILPNGQVCVNLQLDSLTDVYDTARLFGPDGTDVNHLSHGIHGIGPNGLFYTIVPAGVRVHKTLRISQDESVDLYGPTSLKAQGLTSDFRVMWEMPVGKNPEVLCSTSDGTVFISSCPENSDRYVVQAINPIGVQEWNLSDRVLSFYRMAINSDGTIYSGGEAPSEKRAYLCAFR